MTAARTARRLALAAALLLACGPEGDAAFSPSAHCIERCEILFACLEQPTGPADRDRQEFAECVGDCVDGLERTCERETAFECTECWQRRTCEEVTTGWCDLECFGNCDEPLPP